MTYIQKGFYFYILYSISIDRFYIGQTSNLKERIVSHREGKSKYSSRAKDWELMYYERYENKLESIRRERQVKSWKSRKKLEELIYRK